MIDVSRRSADPNRGGTRFDGAVAIVTGGARGIGRAVGERLQADGATVAFFDHDAVGGRATEGDLAGGAQPVSFLHVDITDEPTVADATQQVIEAHGRIDILVNNAGVNAYHDAATMSQEDWDRVFAVDLKGAWLCCKHVLPHMRREGRGSIVNIASVHARLTTSGMFPYAAAKSGLVGLTRSLALDEGPAGIRVNAVSPGWTRTQLVAEWLDRQPNPDDAEAAIADVHPLQRIAEPAEVAAVVAFVASDDASFVTGAEFAVDGGLSARFAT